MTSDQRPDPSTPTGPSAGADGVHPPKDEAVTVSTPHWTSKYGLSNLLYKTADGLAHRTDGGPAAVTHNAAQGILERKWYAHNMRHRDNGPAVIFTYRTITPSLIWMREGTMIRLDGPANIDGDGHLIWDSGSIVTEVGPIE